MTLARLLAKGEFAVHDSNQSEQILLNSFAFEPG
jgi:hypothetical protein